MMTKKVFMEVTNEMIFQKLDDIEKRCMNIEKHAIETNGNVAKNREMVKSNRWMIGSAITLSILALGLIVKMAIGI